MAYHVQFDSAEEAQKVLKKVWKMGYLAGVQDQKDGLTEGTDLVHQQPTQNPFDVPIDQMVLPNLD